MPSSQVPIDGPPTMDLFKAIFQDSDSDSDSDEKSNSSSPKTDEKAQHSLPSNSSHSEALDTSTTKSSMHEVASGSNEKSPSLGNANASSTTSATPQQGQRRNRISRFEPLKDDVENQSEEQQKPTNQPADISTHTFIPRKKDAPSGKTIPPVTQGIFANVDLVALNSYRNQEPSEPSKEVKSPWPESVTKLAQDKATKDDESSTDSEDAYGPPVPSHLKNRAQVIQSNPPSTSITKPVDEAARHVTGWVERETKSKSSPKKHKHKARSKSKKERKKKKDKKSKKHKEKKKKKDRRSSSKRRKSSSSDSSESESSSDSD